MSNGDMDIIKVINDVLIVIKIRRTAYNIYKLLGNTVVDDVASIKSDKDVTKL